MEETKERPVTFYEALEKARAKFPAIKKTQTNKHFQSKYAELGSFLDAVIPELSAVGISILQPVDYIELSTGVFHVVSTELTFKGQVAARSRLLYKISDNPQHTGSATTYYRRYGLASLLAIAAEDDDGNDAANINTSPPPPVSRKSNASPNNPNIPSGSPVNGDGVATDKQKGYLRKLLADLNLRGESQSDFTQFVAGQRIEGLSFGSARGLIDMLLKDPERTTAFLNKFAEAIDSSGQSNGHQSDSDEIPW